VVSLIGISKSGWRRCANGLHTSGNDAPSGGKLTPFLLTDIGEGIVEVEILRWHVREGDFVRQFDPLVEVQSDKATVDITSRFQGIVRRIPHRIGDLARVGEPLCFIEVSESPETSSIPAETSDNASASANGTHDESLNQAGTAPAERISSFQPHLDETISTTGSSPRRVRATPAIRGLARAHNIDLSQVLPSGAGGRVLKSDIESFLSSHKEAAPERLATNASPEVSHLDEATTEVSAKNQTPEDWMKTPVQRDRPDMSQHVVSEPIRGLRRAMAKSMAAAAAVPHLVYGEEVTVDRLVDLRRQLAPVVEPQFQGKLSYMPFFIKAISVALEGFPILNATLDDPHDPKCILYQRDHNISIAIDTPGGLIVPNIKQTQQLSVFEIARELHRLQALAKSGKLGQEDLSGGTFALSNIGSIGGIHASPVIMVPQVAISALGRIRRVPRLVTDRPESLNEAKRTALLEVTAAHVLMIVVAADHRIIDGATVANFCARWKQVIESPATLLI
jgi:2-oxoisovalerate dehydrogenase E2 component (dihydrolipoyl transacylase)